MTGPTIEVASWADLAGLATTMEEVEEQMAATSAYAVRWMCRPDGFATSPACLLRPLAEVMESLGEAFTDAGRVWRDDWLREREATVVAARWLAGSDESAGDRFVRAA